MFGRTLVNTEIATHWRWVHVATIEVSPPLAPWAALGNSGAELLALREGVRGRTNRVTAD